MVYNQIWLHFYEFCILITISMWINKLEQFNCQSQVLKLVTFVSFSILLIIKELRQKRGNYASFRSEKQSSCSGSETDKLGFAGNDQPLCPKPRRVGSSIPEFLKPLRCNKHSQNNYDERSGILNMINEKDTDTREYVCTKCSPTCYSGSPPGRTHNPWVHDVQFIHQMERNSPFTWTKFSDKFGCTSVQNGVPTCWKNEIMS